MFLKKGNQGSPERQLLKLKVANKAHFENRR